MKTYQISLVYRKKLDSGKNQNITITVNKCTGHKSTACFSRYDKLTLIENAKSLAGNGFLAS